MPRNPPSTTPPNDACWAGRSYCSGPRSSSARSRRWLWGEANRNRERGLQRSAAPQCVPSQLGRSTSCRARTGRITAARLARRFLRHPDQLARALQRARCRRLGQRLEQRRPRRPPGALLAGRRRQLRALQAFPPGESGGRARQAHRLAGKRPVRLPLHRRGTRAITCSGHSPRRRNRPIAAAKPNERSLPLPPGTARADRSTSRLLAGTGRRATCSSRPTPAQARTGPMIFDSSGNLVWFDPLRSGTGGHQSAGAELRRQAGAHLVAGLHPAAGLRPGRRVDRQLLLPPILRVARRQRPVGGPARIPHHSPEHGADDRVRPDPLQPLERRRPEQRCGHRQPLPGNRPEDAPRQARVASARPCSPLAVLC